MTKKTKFPSTRRHIQIYDEDWDFLILMYGKDSPYKIGPGAMARDMIHTYVARLREQGRQLADAPQAHGGGQ